MKLFLITYTLLKGFFWIWEKNKFQRQCQKRRSQRSDPKIRSINIRNRAWHQTHYFCYNGSWRWKWLVSKVIGFDAPWFIVIYLLRIEFSDGKKIQLMKLLEPILVAKKFKSIPKMVINQFCRGTSIIQTAFADDSSDEISSGLSNQVNGQE